jgi:heme/copper-type cytochrome/quinol oxidase subunit 1
MLCLCFAYALLMLYLGWFANSLLSMGSVYAIFAAFYYWIGKITGYQYPDSLAQIHFWLFTIGINLVFFPMHFLGINGMPRRVPDYPDAFAAWNSIMSLGSIISLFSIIVFILTLIFTFRPFKVIRKFYDLL